MDQTPDELEREALSLDRNGFQPTVTPLGEEDAILTEVRRIVKMADGHEDQLMSRYAEDYLTLMYDGNVFAHYSASRPAEEWGQEEAWIEFDMYPALHAKYAPDPRFAGVQDKDAKFWRIYLSRPEDVDKYKDVILDEIL